MGMLDPNRREGSRYGRRWTEGSCLTDTQAEWILRTKNIPFKRKLHLDSQPTLFDDGTRKNQNLLIKYGGGGRCTYPSWQQHILRRLGVVAFDVPLAAMHQVEMLRIGRVNEALLYFAL